ncbi:DUF6176 family protein [Furfurilactobacillus siliginis]|uniref:ABM domain-containing protein n=1 Tax=Furfurilactobacillus siliginis TaxID=348151 RepID=A0A0R2LF21_9LACO|nr:DUF6176 family protein [Furfurilactobacillus siliginis]KRN97239.1 hypothetical protein IV55_GL000164 [Furfurilactobacillus siliginis]GEK29614.1 hypothetical protein LSI01_19250 [Furfurilactobacillus siliginis]
MQTELMGFPVKLGKEETAMEWMTFLKAHQQDFLKTLPDEQMMVESIFTTTISGKMYLCWYSIQGENPRRVEDSDNELDRKHVAYWEDCIDEQQPPLRFKHIVNYVPTELTNTMSELY